jgi:hypothetical protein
LKGFLAAKKDEIYDDFLFVYKKGMPFKTDGIRKENNPSKSGVGNTAFVRNFYAFLKEDGTTDTETYEIKLQREIEKPADDVLNKLRTIQLKKGEVIKVTDFLSDDERRKFIRYAGGMYARSKKNREKFNTIVQEASKDTNKQGFSFAELATQIPPNEKKKFDEHFRLVNPKFDESTGRFSVPTKYIEEFSDKTQKDESFPKSIFRAIDLLEPIVLNMKWQIRITPTLNNFFTGDFPVFYTNLRNPNAEFLFPISSNTIFCASNNQNLSENIFLEKDYEFVVSVRDIFARQCRELYFSLEAKWLVDFFNKR